MAVSSPRFGKKSFEFEVTSVAEWWIAECSGLATLAETGALRQTVTPPVRQIFSEFPPTKDYYDAIGLLAEWFEASIVPA